MPALMAALTGASFSIGPGALTKIIDDTGNVLSVGVGRINDSNTVAYNYRLRIGFDTIATYQNGTRYTVVAGAEYWPPFLRSINNAGTISFAANIPDGHYGVVTRNGTTTNIVTGAISNSPVVDTLGQMSGNGSAVFSSTRDVNALYMGNGGALATIASTAVGEGFSALDSSGPVVNEAGTIAFYGAKNDESWGYYLSEGKSSKRLFSPGWRCGASTRNSFLKQQIERCL